jgi:hypothetical protein
MPEPELKEEKKYNYSVEDFPVLENVAEKEIPV